MKRILGIILSGILLFLIFSFIAVGINSPILMIIGIVAAILGATYIKKKELPVKKLNLVFLGIMISTLIFAGIFVKPVDEKVASNTKLIQEETKPIEKIEKNDEVKEEKQEEKKEEVKDEVKEEKNDEIKEEEKEVSQNKDTTDENTKTVNGELKVHFIDVGQGDCILIEQGTKSMLIDAGNRVDDYSIKHYLSKQGTSKIDFLIVTHPHDDHIGGMKYIINSFKIGKMYMPDETCLSGTYKNMMKAVENKKIKRDKSRSSRKFNLGKAKCTILSPYYTVNNDYNNHSLVVKVEYGSTSFLFTGDAEDKMENELISKGDNLNATVLKVGNHGSDSSTTSEFLDKVNPEYAVVSVGADNSYGNPQLSTMNRLKDRGIEVYRTDENGTIVATSDGSNVTFSTSPGSYNGN